MIFVPIIQAPKFSDVKHQKEIVCGRDLLKMCTNTKKADKKLLEEIGLYKRFSFKFNSTEYLFLYIFIC